MTSITTKTLLLIASTWAASCSSTASYNPAARSVALFLLPLRLPIFTQKFFLQKNSSEHNLKEITFITF